MPLLRPGFRPSGSYAVTFVYLHAGTPFARKGEMQMTLPKMDIPVGIVEWEVFVPDNYSVRAIDGNVIDRRSMVRAFIAGNGKDGSGPGVGSGLGPGSAGGVGGGVYLAAAPDALPGQIRGRAADADGSVLPGVTIVLEAGRSRQVATTGPDGSFLLSGVPSGPVTITAQLDGFRSGSPLVRLRSAAAAGGFLDAGCRRQRVAVHDGDRRVTAHRYIDRVDQQPATRRNRSNRHRT